MGKLKTTLKSAEDLLKSISKSIDDAADELDAIVNDTWQLMQIACQGVDEVYFYLQSKLKKDGKKFDDELKSKISDYADGNVNKFLKGIADGAKDACNKSAKWSSVGGGLKGDLSRLGTVLKDIEGQIAKKKKKLLQSKKYKAKIVVYEKALDELSKASGELEKQLEKVLANEAPPPSQVQKNLNLKASDTLGDLDKLASIEAKNILKKYEGHQKETVGGTRKLRQAGDFKAELKTIQEWIKEADEIEEEAEDSPR